MIFDPDSFNPTALAFGFDVGDDAVSTALGLLEDAGQVELAVQIEVGAEPSESEDGRKTLLAAAAVIAAMDRMTSSAVSSSGGQNAWDFPLWRSKVFLGYYLHRERLRRPIRRLVN